MGLYGTKLETTTGYDNRWLRSSFGHDAGLPVTLKLDAFPTAVGATQAATKDDDGTVHIPAGIPLAAKAPNGSWLNAEHKYVPYLGDAETQVLAGFLKVTIDIPSGYTGEVSGALLYATVVRVAHLPFSFAGKVTLADVKAGNLIAVLEYNEAL